MEEDKKIRDILKTDVLFRPTATPIYCRECGTRLKFYYAEERVCAVKCGYCEYIGIVRADSPNKAAFYFGEEKRNDKR